jgi:hypothetical protein
MGRTTTTTYTPESLPPFKPATAGYMLPNPDGTAVVCVAPVAVDWPYPTSWGKPEGATMAVPAGGWLSSVRGTESYYNREFRDTSSLTGRIVDPQDDPRAKGLHDAWAARGYAVLTLEAKKMVGVEVLGEVAADAVGDEIQTPEGPVVLGAGDVVVKSPRTGDVWRIQPDARAKRYLEGGRIFGGSLPAEYR